MTAFVAGNDAERRWWTKTASIAAFAAVLALTGARPAFALDGIYSPNAEPYEFALEYSGSTTFDHDPKKRDAQSHEFSVEYGVSDRLMLEASGTWAKDPEGPLQFDGTAIEGRWQFFEQGAHWLDSGLLVAYGLGMQGGAPDDLEVKLLLEKDFGNYTARVNMGFEQQIGANAQSGGPDYAFLASTRYRYSYHFEPAIELQSDLGQGRDLGKFKNQEDYVGPALYGHLLPHLKYEAAYLFGVGGPAASGAARLLLEYEMVLY